MVVTTSIVFANAPNRCGYGGTQAMARHGYAYAVPCYGYGYGFDSCYDYGYGSA